MRTAPVKLSVLTRVSAAVRKFSWTSLSCGKVGLPVVGLTVEEMTPGFSSMLE
jgi:hypothetical protein